MIISCFGNQHFNLTILSVCCFHVNLISSFLSERYYVASGYYDASSAFLIEFWEITHFFSVSSCEE